MTERHGCQWSRPLACKQALRVGQLEHCRFGHPIVEERREFAQRSSVEHALSLKAIGHAALDTLDRLETAHVRDIGGLAGPGRNRARTRYDHEVRWLIARGGCDGVRSRSVRQQRLEDSRSAIARARRVATKWTKCAVSALTPARRFSMAARSLAVRKSESADAPGSVSIVKAGDIFAKADRESTAKN